MVTWDFRFCVLTERSEDGFVMLAADPYGEEGALAGATVPLESASPFGFLSVPRDPDTDGAGNVSAAGACGLLVLEHGGQDYAIPVQDPRYAAALPPVKKGGSMQYATLPELKVAFSLFDGDNGTYQVYVPVGDSGHTIALNAQSDAESITIQHAKGHAVTLDKDGNIQLRNEDNTVSITVTSSEVIINAGVVRIQGGVVMGGDAAGTLLKATETLAWITGVLLPALASAPGGPITVAAPPAAVATVNTKGG